MNFQGNGFHHGTFIHMCSYALFLFAPLTALYCQTLLVRFSVQIVITQSVFTSHVFYHMFLCLPLYRLHTLSSYHVFSIIMSYVGAIYVAHINNCAYINLLFVFLNQVYFASLNDLHFNPFFCQCHDFILFWGD